MKRNVWFQNNKSQKHLKVFRNILLDCTSSWLKQALSILVYLSLRTKAEWLHQNIHTPYSPCLAKYQNKLLQMNSEIGLQQLTPVDSENCTSCMIFQDISRLRVYWLQERALTPLRSTQFVRRHAEIPSTTDCSSAVWTAKFPGEPSFLCLTS